MRFIISGFLIFGACWTTPVVAAGQAKHVVVVVWDGMRPDFVTPELTPTLYQLGREGVVFPKHHSVYLSATEVNGTALATGDYPAHSGVIANREYRPAIDPLKIIGTESRDAIRKADKASAGQYLHRPTLPEILQQRGLRTIIAGAKPVVLLWDRSERTDANAAGINLFAGNALPAAWQERITEKLGDFPALEQTKAKRDDWTTSALLGPLWSDGVPPFTLLWLSEPDYSQHETGPGSTTALAMLKNSDQNLARVLEFLGRKGLRDKTDVLVVSDHGFSTIAETIDLASLLNQAGFKAMREFKAAPARDEILVAGNGGSVLLYLPGHDRTLTKRVVAFLQSQAFTGVIFTRQGLPGTFALKAAGLDSPDAPDIVISLRWTSEKNAVGVPGMIYCDEAGRVAGQGMHATLSPSDMHNTLIAAGPNFRRGVVNALPSGNVDIAPTVLHLLGLKPPRPMDGRVLQEALVGGGSGPRVKPTERLEAKKDLGKQVWRQYLKLTKVGGVTYLDEGNGAVSVK